MDHSNVYEKVVVWEGPEDGQIAVFLDQKLIIHFISY